MKEIKLYYKAGPLGDETSIYDVVFEKGTLVQDVIDFALSNKNEWGYIEIIDNLNRWPSYTHRQEYKYGEIIKDNIPNDVCQKKIKNCSANGGWSRMDYIIKI